MTVQEKLIERVQQMTDEEAEGWLRRVDELRVQNGQASKESAATQADQPRTLLEAIDALAWDTSKEEWETSPGDLAEQVNHYAYGNLKQSQCSS